MAFLDYLQGPVSYALGKLGVGNPVSGLASALSGTPAQTQNFNKFTPGQQAGKQQVLQQALQGLGQPNQFDFAPIEQQAREQFKTQTIPSIAERFTKMGSNLSGSGYNAAITRGGSQLERDLAALKSQVGLQHQGQKNQLLSNLLGIGLQPEFDTAYQPRQPGFGEELGVQGLQQILQYLIPILLGGATGGPVGAAAGFAGSGGLNSILQALGG